MAGPKRGASPLVLDAVAQAVRDSGPVQGKPPLDRVDCSTYTDEVGGIVYASHHGESVWKRSGLTTAGIGLVQDVGRFFQLLTRMQDADIEDPTDTDSAEGVMGVAGELGECLASLDAGIAEAIVRWDWTDPDGLPYPTKPTAAVISTLSIDERTYLASALFGKPVQEGDPVKN